MENQAQNVSSNVEVASANGWFQIAVSNDELFATVKKIVRHAGNGKPVTTRDIFKKLKELKVVYGIDRDAIENLVKFVEDNNIPEEPVVIAKGDVENGENGSIKWCIEGASEENSNILLVPKVKIAERTLATQGKKGKSIYGKPKNPRPGFDQQLKNGEGVVCHQDSNDVLIYESSYVGLLCYKSGTLSVNSGITVSENKLQVYMDINTGKVTGTEKNVTAIDIYDTLKNMGIKYGINTERIKAAIEKSDASNEVIENVLVAEGKAPVNGSDDEIQWCIDVQAEDISKSAVLPGQTIAVLKSNFGSVPGVNVYGDEIDGIDGAELSVNCGNGIEKINKNDSYYFNALLLGVAQYDGDTLSIKSGVKISDDKLKVTMSMLRPDIANDDGNILLRHVTTTLNEHGIIYGIKEKAINLILENINKERKSKIDLIVAEGMPAKDGVDTRVDFAKELSVGGKVLDNGKIDFHEKSYPWNVKENDVIGKIIPAQRSEDGRNVLGEELIANQVKDSEPELEGIVKESDGTLRVTEDGILLIDGVNFKVTDSLELAGDVCQKTGNIHSDKTVNVKGYVGAGFVLETKGDAIIQENVEDAIVSAEGSVVIKSGVRGTHSKVTAGGSLTASFAENADLNAEGDILITNSIINCHVVCHGMVHVGDANSRKSALVGDITHADKGIEASILGSDSFNKTIIEAGATRDSFTKFKDMTATILDIKKNITDINRLYEHCCKNPKSQEEQNALLIKLTGTRDLKNKEYQNLLEEKEKLKILIEESKNVKVIVHKKVYPGVTIRILNQTYEVSEERNSGIFCLKGDEIIFEAA
jgi:uncharacterized protein